MAETPCNGLITPDPVKDSCDYEQWLQNGGREEEQKLNHGGHRGGHCDDGVCLIFQIGSHFVSLVRLAEPAWICPGSFFEHLSKNIQNKIEWFKVRALHGPTPMIRREQVDEFITYVPVPLWHAAVWLKRCWNYSFVACVHRFHLCPLQPVIQVLACSLAEPWSDISELLSIYECVPFLK